MEVVVVPVITNKCSFRTVAEVLYQLFDVFTAYEAVSGV